MANKEVKKSKKFYLYLTIITSIQDNGKLPKNISKQRLNYYLKTLKINGLVEKKGYGVWEITPLGKQYIQKKEVKKSNLDTPIQPPKKYIRGHGYRWQIKTPKSPSHDTLLKILSNFKPFVNGNKNVQITLHSHAVHIGKSSIIVYFNKNCFFNAKTAKMAHRLAIYELKRLITRLENILGYSLQINQRYRFKPCFKHFGEVNNELALEFQKKKKGTRIYKDGKEWLVIDFSRKEFPEIETTDNKRNIVDMDYAIAPFFNKLRDEPKVIDRIEQENKRLMKIVEDQQKMLRHLLEKEKGSFDNFKY